MTSSKPPVLNHRAELKTFACISYIMLNVDRLLESHSSLLQDIYVSIRHYTIALWKTYAIAVVAHTHKYNHFIYSTFSNDGHTAALKKWKKQNSHMWKRSHNSTTIPPYLLKALSRLLLWSLNVYVFFLSSFSCAFNFTTFETKGTVPIFLNWTTICYSCKVQLIANVAAGGKNFSSSDLLDSFFLKR